MRFRAPGRGDIEAAVLHRPPLAGADIPPGWLDGPHWPTLDQLDAALPPDAGVRFVAQTPALLADGCHYEERIAGRGLVATRERNWHDLFNALAWCRHLELKRALNRRQAAEVVRMGPAVRSRAQHAMTHFDEAGVIVRTADRTLLALWDAHDWHGLFWRRRDAWRDGSVQVAVFGHALLEQALAPGRWLVGKAVVVLGAAGIDAEARVCRAIADGRLLRDPQELRPLPLSGIPGWHPDNGEEGFHRLAPCYRPLRPGRRYPPPLRAREAATGC